MSEEIILYYVGKERGAFVPGLPARDLTRAEVEASGWTVDQLAKYREVYSKAPQKGAEGSGQKQ